VTAFLTVAVQTAMPFEKHAPGFLLWDGLQTADFIGELARAKKRL
jgi:hypothetical protein